mmetsp:Transcript_49412/g.105188  ORF Transcript_49412/g.105188 Transcript_49412/m.105188 type:complete len:268 (+) Transcript_49412:186-989(+)|eukprot:CAMPEP_0206428992 /NCGR_PEP_ID=MMETSP0324_2-20121206/5982_1 /ASSEMBLY_ACC=CAM_ASM_000836 /TAXON_ID=2866 /ORGANISM="Crypthecodinium cohnii, Strain Seligo" /LENGTH=267 /DNA_ID=CAMNT_0053894601 /DNA_START=154 /DNA_END=957 /DNA_ORIENTATION=-
MDLNDLEFSLKFASSGGNVLNCQELLGLQSGLNLLLHQERTSGMYFWGKLFGSSSDYYVAYALKDSPSDKCPEKQFYFSREDFSFSAIPKVGEDIAAKIASLNLTTPLEGDPSAALPSFGGGAPLTELMRLSTMIEAIDADTAVVPKGAYSLNENNIIVANSSFQGLPNGEATSLAKYVHLRPATDPGALRAAARSDAEYYSNFLDGLDADLPKQCWTVRQEMPTAPVTIRSLSWPGYTAFHVPGSTKFGGVYFGYGQKVRDLPFLM